MSRWKRSPGLLLVTGYLCLFFCLLPPVHGAILNSSSVRGSEGAEAAAVEQLTALGLSREEAEARVTAYREAGANLAAWKLLAGGSPPQDYDPPINNIALVFLICGAAVGIGFFAASRD